VLLLGICDYFDQFPRRRFFLGGGGSDITPQFCTVAMFGIDDVGVAQLPCSFTSHKLSFNQSCNFSRAFPHHPFDCYSIDIIYEENRASINMEWPSVAINLYKVL